jgi:hypothetical protein
MDLSPLTDPSAVSAWTRGLERLAVVGLSGLSLILGWDLFRRGVVNAQSADLKGHGWSVRLQRVGPGIFFALFATVAFVSAISHPLEITSGKKTEQESKTDGADISTVTTEDQTITNAAKAGTSTDRDVIAAINTFHLIVLPRASKGSDTSETAAISNADRTLDSYKKALMFQHFGQMSIQFYSIHDKVPSNPAILQKQTSAFQDRYSEIEGWDKDTFLRSR